MPRVPWGGACAERNLSLSLSLCLSLFLSLSLSLPEFHNCNGTHGWIDVAPKSKSVLVDLLIVVMGKDVAK